MHGATIRFKVLLCLTDTSLYIYICVKQFGMANIKPKPRLQDNLKSDIQQMRKVHGCRRAISCFCERGNETSGSVKGKAIT